jgi:hypothetical protein
MRQQSNVKFDNDFFDIGSYGTTYEESGYYRHTPQMMPWVGEEYDGDGHKKILFIGQSHYLPDSADKKLFTVDGWYEQEENSLNPDGEEYDWTNTRVIISQRNWSSKAHGIYRDIDKAIREVANVKKPPYIGCDNMFRFVAFYNYFLRPASKGTSFKNIIQDKDKEIAKDAVNDIIGLLKPDYIYFLSKFAWETFCKNDLKHPDISNIIVDYSPNPSSSWRNRKNFKLNNEGELLSGHQKLIAFLKQNEVF